MAEQHRNVFYEIDEACHPYPADIQEQDYRLNIDFTTLEAQLLLLMELATSVEDHDEEDLKLLGGLIYFIEDIIGKRIPNPGGPQ